MGLIARTLRRLLPEELRRRIAIIMVSNRDFLPTISEGWDAYASARSDDDNYLLGDEWNNIEFCDGSVRPSEAAAYLDEKVFAPFLDHCETILEIGAGGGRFTVILLPKAKQVIAADTSSAMLKHLQKRCGNNPNLRSMLLDGYGLGQIDNNSIDAVFSYGVFVHLQHWDIYNYLIETQRVLKPGGKAVIHHSNTFSEKGWAYFLSEVNPSLNRHKLYGSFTVMTVEMMRKFAEKAGLSVNRQITDIVKRDCITLLTKPASLEAQPDNSN